MQRSVARASLLTPPRFVSDELHKMWGPSVSDMMRRGLPMDKRTVDHILEGGAWLGFETVFLCSEPLLNGNFDHIVMPVVMETVDSTCNLLRRTEDERPVPWVCAALHPDHDFFQMLYEDERCIPFWDLYPLLEGMIPEALALSNEYMEILRDRGVEMLQELQHLFEAGEIDPETCWRFVNNKELSEIESASLSDALIGPGSWVDEDDVTFYASLWQEYIDRGEDEIFKAIPTLEDAFTWSELRLVHRARNYTKAHKSAFMASLAVDELRTFTRNERSYI